MRGVDRAVILAGGKGSRLKSVVPDKPKAMASIAGRPFLEYQIRFLKRFGIRDLVLCVGSQYDHIKTHFGYGAAWDISIQYNVEAIPHGTAGALKAVENWLTKTFLVLNGDTYLGLDLETLIVYHSNIKTIYQKAHSDAVVVTRATVPKMSAGVYIMEPRIFDFIPSGGEISLEKETFPRLLQRGFLFSLSMDGFFIDIGTPKGYRDFVRCVETLTL